MKVITKSNKINIQNKKHLLLVVFAGLIGLGISFSITVILTNRIQEYNLAIIQAKEFVYEVKDTENIFYNMLNSSDSTQATYDLNKLIYRLNRVYYGFIDSKIMKKLKNKSNIKRKYEITRNLYLKTIKYKIQPT